VDDITDGLPEIVVFVLAVAPLLLAIIGATVGFWVIYKNYRRPDR
jgi:hypothetical protein